MFTFTESHLLALLSTDRDWTPIKAKKKRIKTFSKKTTYKTSRLLLVHNSVKDLTAKLHRYHIYRGLALYMHRVRKKRPEYTWHNFDKFRHSFVIFGTNHPDKAVY